jgi:hypothetical protein
MKMMTMEGYEKWFHDALDAEGYSLPNWKVKIIDREVIRNRYGQITDYETFTVYIYKPRCRKPLQCHYFKVNTVKNTFWFENCSFFDF